MVAVTFEARVVDGRLQHAESLAALEGQQVRVSLTVPEAAGPERNGKVPHPDESPEGSDELPDWLDVEKDIYVKIPFEYEILRDVKIVDGGLLEPCIILPEDLPDPTPDGKASHLDDGSVEPPAWMDVEKDIYVKMFGKIEMLKGVKVLDPVPGKPCLIFPEELPDE